MAAMLRRQCEKGGTIVPAQEVVIDDTWVNIEFGINVVFGSLMCFSAGEYPCCEGRTTGRAP